MSTPILRGLAKAYSDGLIDRKQYIHARRHLIDDIVAGNVEIVPYEAGHPTRDPDPERTVSGGEATLEMPRVDPETETRPVNPPKSGHTGLVIAVVVIGAAAAYGGWRLLATNPPPLVPDAVPATAKKRAAPNPAAALLDGFLEQNNWRAERIEGFLLAWESESGTAREALGDTPLMRRAAELIAQQLVEEKALYELGEREEALHKQRRLLDLAAALSITNDRLARAEDEWQANNTALAAAAEATTSAAALATTDTPLPAEPDSPMPDPAVIDATTAVAEAPPTIANPAPEPAPPEPDEPLSEDTVEPDVDAAPVVAAPVVPAPAPTSAVPAREETSAAPATAQTAVKAPPKRSGCRAELAQKRRPYCRDALARNVNGPMLAVLAPGEAVVGGVKPEEQPRFTVKLERPFGFGVYEVSVNELNTFCRATGRTCPAQPWPDPKFPAVNVSWSLATAYTAWLSQKTGATYRLPSESEWEYAARAGTTTPYPFGDEVLPTHARFSFRGSEAAPLAADDRTVNRNKFRLYHMIGNVREWVLDVWHDDHAGAASDGSARSGDSGARVARGGSYADGADRVRSASRVRIDGNSGDAQTGFRVLREID